MKYLDIHTHHVAAKDGIIAIQNISLSEETFLAMPKTKAISIGLHPWYSELADLNKNLKYLNVLARQKNVKLIGECGLDKLRGESISNQAQIFEAQLLFAVQINKPVIIHCVKAFDELIAIKKKIQPQVPLIVHGFNKKAELAHQLISNGFLLSFGAAVLQSSYVAEIVSTISTPFFLETDDADISIEEIYIKVADLRKISVNELKDIIFANWKAIDLI